MTPRPGLDRIEDHSKAVADVNEMVAAVAIAASLDHDAALRRKVRRYADCPDHQPLKLKLPIGSAGLQLQPDGSLHPLRAAETQAATDFDTLISRNPELQARIERARPRIVQSVQAAILPFLAPGALPSREEYVWLERWAPLIERPAYRFSARAVGELESWRASALAEANEGARGTETVLEHYYALLHTIAHLTLLCSGPGATPWLADMAKSFTWTNWTPTIALVRERTLWLAAAAARSANAFGATIVDRYVEALGRATHVTQLFDALFGLAAIGVSDPNVRDQIVAHIAAEEKVLPRRLMVGAEFAYAALRSAKTCLTRGPEDAPDDQDLLARLSWRPRSSRGLATPEAFRLDPTDIDGAGQMIGYRALPHILGCEVALHYPPRPDTHGRLLPTLAEMPDLLTRAWGTGDRTPRTVH